METHIKLKRPRYNQDSCPDGTGPKNFAVFGLKMLLEFVSIFSCIGLAETRKRLKNFTIDYISDKPELQPIVDKYLGESEVEFCQFIIDCSVQSLVISSYQLYGKSILDHLFYITRTWCYSLHKERLRQLGRINCD